VFLNSQFLFCLCAIISSYWRWRWLFLASSHNTRIPRDRGRYTSMFGTALDAAVAYLSSS
jgi:hypothetical protein